jgi:hypothetical protein
VIRLVVRTAHAGNQPGTVEITGEREEDRAWLEQNQGQAMEAFGKVCWERRQRFISKKLVKDIAEQTRRALQARFPDQSLRVDVEPETLKALTRS